MFVDKDFENCLIEELFNLQLGKTPDRTNYNYWNNKDYKWVSIADMGKYYRFTEDTAERISELAINETGIKIVPKNTVIMSFKLTIGRTAITSEPIYTNEAIMAFIKKEKNTIENDYLRIWLSLNDWSIGQMNAVKGKTLNKDSIGKVKIPLPPIQLQKDFSNYVDHLDKLRFEAKQRKEKLEQQKISAINKYFR